MDYLPGQYGMHYEHIGLNDYHFDSLGLAGHRPYYAFAGNQLATGEQGSNGNYYWMQQQHSGQHIVGQKQYELTNHLGNVQVTVSDLPYKHGNDTITRISPALKAVYDYYPFGSPMPGRTIMDTARKCVDMTRLDRVWKAWEMTQTEIYAFSLINYHLDGEGEVFIDDNGAVEVEIADEHAVFYMDLQDSLNNGGEMVLHLNWLEELGEKGFQLYVQGLDATGEMRIFYQKHYKNPEDAVYLNIADSFTNVSVGIQGALHFRIDNIRYAGGSWVNEEVLVRVCDDGGDRYRFGFNGQEKVNEIAGMGNHNTAEFWEYDTRLGRRWNVDPVDQISVSNYAVNGNNPIWRYDVLGDKWKTKADEKKAASLDKSLESRKNQLNKQANKFQARADKKLAKGKEDKANRLLAKANEARVGVWEMGQAQTELTEIGASEIELTFQQKTGNVSYTYMDAGGTVVIEFTTDANAIHELTHAYQHLSGQVELVAGTGGGYYVDVTDEQQAYRRQFFFSPFSVQGLNSDSSIRIKTSEDIKVDWILKLWTYDKDGNKIYPYSGLSTTPANKPGSPADKK